MTPGVLPASLPAHSVPGKGKKDVICCRGNAVSQGAFPGLLDGRSRDSREREGERPPELRASSVGVGYSGGLSAVRTCAAFTACEARSAPGREPAAIVWRWRALRGAHLPLRPLPPPGWGAGSPRKSSSEACVHASLPPPSGDSAVGPTQSPLTSWGEMI